MSLEERAEALAKRVLCHDYIARDWDVLLAEVTAAFRAAVAEKLEEAARLAESPYGDAVHCYGYDEPSTVGRRIAAAIRARATAICNRPPPAPAAPPSPDAAPAP